MRVRLTKVKIKNAQSSFVQAGQTTTGTLYKAKRRKNGTMHRPIKVSKLTSILPKYELLVADNIIQFIKTSAIQKIIRVTKNTLTFETETSIYKISLIKE